jgi:hypothetical protein
MSQTCLPVCKDGLQKEPAGSFSVCHSSVAPRAKRIGTYRVVPPEEPIHERCHALGIEQG